MVTVRDILVHKGPQVLTIHRDASVLDAALVLLDEALAVDDYPTARRLADTAEAAAIRLRSVPLVASVRRRQQEVAALEKELDQLSQRYRALSSQLLNRDHVLEAIGELARILPSSTFLTNYSYQDGAITISGFAQSASEIQNLLEGSPLFKGVEFTNSVTREPTGKDRFTLKMVLEDQK